MVVVWIWQKIRENVEKEEPHGSQQPDWRFGLALLAILLVASLVDYPLRVPLFMILAVFAMVQFVNSRTRRI